MAQSLSTPTQVWSTEVNPIRLTLALIISLFTGSLLLLISAPDYYMLIFTAGRTVQLGFLPLQHSALLSLYKAQPLLIGMLFGSIASIALYNLLRFIYTRYQCNLLFGIALSFLLLFSYTCSPSCFFYKHKQWHNLYSCFTRYFIFTCSVFEWRTQICTV